MLILCSFHVHVTEVRMPGGGTYQVVIRGRLTLMLQQLDVGKNWPCKPYRKKNTVKPGQFKIQVTRKKICEL
jgi:hypothetical protein